MKKPIMIHVLALFLISTLAGCASCSSDLKENGKENGKEEKPDTEEVRPESFASDDEMLDYIHWQGCRRQRMLASLDESVTRFPAKCCDYHGATMDLGTPTSQKEKRGTKDWQEILQRMFKD